MCHKLFLKGLNSFTQIPLLICQAATALCCPCNDATYFHWKEYHIILQPTSKKGELKVTSPLLANRQYTVQKLLFKDQQKGPPEL